jgi:hypothetical protein
MGKNVTLKPGESMAVPIQSLTSGMRNQTGRCYWTQAGRVHLAASYTTLLSGRTPVTVHAAPVALKVVEPD